MQKKVFISILIFILVIINFQSKKKINKPTYRIEQQGLNDRITNELSDLESTAYLEREVNSFLNQWNLKGASVAIVKDEKLVYAHGFGIADIEENEVQPGHLFRVASISKLITAIGIMHLVESGKLDLDDKVFGPQAILDNPVFDQVRDNRIYKITIRELLAHSAGWTQRYGDPAFLPLKIAELTGDETPVTMYSYYKYIASRRLSFTPGGSYAYSNMGYMFLTDVIEKLSGQTYEEYIRNEILIPNDIFDMHIGSSFQAQKRFNEVNYWVHEENDTIPCFDGSGLPVSKANGGNSIELLGAAGGWICSSVELARLITLIDGQDQVPDILSPESIREMTNNITTRGPLGWRSVYANGSWVRTGSMAGTVAKIKRMENGCTWIFISNTSNWKGNKLERNIDFLMTKVIHRTKAWSKQDLFNYFGADDKEDEVLKSQTMTLGHINGYIYYLS
ncbi:MAG: serine hydrolase domain-containing protein [Mangrovibacterium sp.]